MTHDQQLNVYTFMNDCPSKDYTGTFKAKQRTGLILKCLYRDIALGFFCQLGLSDMCIWMWVPLRIWKCFIHFRCARFSFWCYRFHFRTSLLFWWREEVVFIACLSSGQIVSHQIVLYQPCENKELNW